MSDPEAVPYLDGHCATHGRPDQFHALCTVTWRSPFGVEFRCSCPNHIEPNSPDSDSAIGGALCDNERAKSDPALRQQPGSWPDSVRESDMTQSTRTSPPMGTPRGDA